MRARLWYGPAGRDVEMAQIARYLRGPLGCSLQMHERNRAGRWQSEIELTSPITAWLVQERGLTVSGEAADLVSRLPAEAPQRLAQRLARCTVRLDLSDPPGRRFTPATGVARSVLIPLAFALGGMVEDIDSRRMFYFPFPESEGALARLRRSLDEMLQVVRWRRTTRA